jgi:hypothetical protein
MTPPARPAGPITGIMPVLLASSRAQLRSLTAPRWGYGAPHLGALRSRSGQR